jgi:hypothetical protein
MQTGRGSHGPAALFLLFFLFHNFAAFVVTTVGANGVGQAHLAAVTALHKVARL